MPTRPPDMIYLLLGLYKVFVGPCLCVVAGVVARAIIYKYECVSQCVWGPRSWILDAVATPSVLS